MKGVLGCHIRSCKVAAVASVAVGGGGVCEVCGSGCIQFLFDLYF